MNATKVHYVALITVVFNCGYDNFIGNRIPCLYSIMNFASRFGFIGQFALLESGRCA